MTKQTQLISIYLAVCKSYSTTLVWEAQRLSNNFHPKFTDEEAITCYIFGITERRLTMKDIYNFICDYWHGWFPDIPCYKQFVTQINYLAPAIQTFAYMLLRTHFDAKTIEYLLDSLPIVVASNKRSNRAKAANEICDKGYCASKGMYCYGVRLHGIVQSQPHKLPIMHYFRVEPASSGDITIAKDMLQTAENMTIYADKAYIDACWQAELAKRNVTILTPVKLKKDQSELERQFRYAADKLWSRAVSGIRQSIESFFSWLQDKTQIQYASKIRSANGLIAFIFARIAAVAFEVNW